MGFMRPSSGRGTLLGKPFGDAATRRRVGFLAENVALYHRPADSLVRFYGALNGLRGAELDRRAAAALDAVKLSGEAQRNVGKFSRGMAQRVGLAQALVNDPDLLVLDEPTSALDPIARVTVRELLLTLRNQGRTVFLSSHLLSEVELVCDRIAIVVGGRLMRLGRTADLLHSSEQMRIAFRGVPRGAIPGAVAEGGALELLAARSELQPALYQIWHAGGEVLSVNPAQRSLEELFLEVTREAEAEGMEAAS
jgi:ABC-2 type transport system ATP-binding protein